MFKYFIDYNFYKILNKKLKIFKFRKNFFPFIFKNFIYNIDFIKNNYLKILIYRKFPIYLNNIKEFLILEFLFNYTPLIKLSIYRSLYFLKLFNFKKNILKKHMNIIYMFFFCKKDKYFYFNLINFNYYLFIINNFKFNFFFKNFIFNFFLKNFLLVSKKSFKKKKYNYKEFFFFKKIFKSWRFHNLFNKFYLNILFIKKKYSFLFNLKKNKNYIYIFIYLFLFFLSFFLNLFF